MPVYIGVFLSNGHSPNEPRLIEMAQKMGGTSAQIWAGREYRAEAIALHYLRDKISQRTIPKSLLKRIAENVKTYAQGYAEQFDLEPMLPTALVAVGRRP